MKKPVVSVIIPSRNEKDSIIPCVRSILNNDYGKEFIEVLIVDGLSNDGTREILNSFIETVPGIKLIDNPLQITPAAFNRGIENAGGEYILIVGARHILSSNYITTCLNYLNTISGCECVGGAVENIYETENSEIIAAAMASAFGVGGGNFRILKENSFVDTVGTPLYRKSIFKEVGTFDTALVRNQDDEFNYRLIKKGYKVFFTPEATIKYKVRATFKHLRRQYFQYGYWKVYVNKKHRTITTFRQLIPALFIVFLFSGLLLPFLPKFFIYAYSSLLLLYLSLALSISFKTYRSVKALKMVYSFFILHFSYGLGYLSGFCRFIILNKKPAIKQTELSR